MTGRGVRCLLLLLLVVAMLPAGPAWSRDESTRHSAELSAAAESFAKAGAVDGTQARQDAYRAAARAFESVIAAGHVNGALEYNTANAWFLAGDVGPAILHYRRALRLRPGDPEIEANLATARSRRMDRIESASGDAVLDTVFFWHGRMSLPAKRRGGLVLYALGFALLALVAWRRSSPRIVLIAGLGCLVIAAALLVSAGIESTDLVARQDAVVLADEMPLRKGDGYAYPPRYENPLHTGAEVRIVEERGGWVRVVLPNGNEGWLPVSAVERV